MSFFWVTGMWPRTIFLSRLIGLYAIFVSVAMISHKPATVQMVTELVHDPPLLFLGGLIGIGIGLAMVLGHNVWSGGALPVVVTIVGWTTLMKGVLLIFVSPESAPGVFLGTLQYARLFYMYASITLLLGIYLSVFGLRRKR